MLAPHFMPPLNPAMARIILNQAHESHCHKKGLKSGVVTKTKRLR